MLMFDNNFSKFVALNHILYKFWSSELRLLRADQIIINMLNLMLFILCAISCWSILNILNTSRSILFMRCWGLRWLVFTNSSTLTFCSKNNVHYTDFWLYWKSMQYVSIYVQYVYVYAIYLCLCNVSGMLVFEATYILCQDLMLDYALTNRFLCCRLSTAIIPDTSS